MYCWGHDTSLKLGTMLNCRWCGPQRKTLIGNIAVYLWERNATVHCESKCMAFMVQCCNIQGGQKWVFGGALHSALAGCFSWHSHKCHTSALWWAASLCLCWLLPIRHKAQSTYNDEQLRKSDCYNCTSSFPDLSQTFKVWCGRKAHH